MKLEKFLADLRKQNNFTQNAIYDELKKHGVYIERSTYAKYETNKRSVPCEVVIALSKIHEISTDIILGCV